MHSANDTKDLKRSLIGDPSRNEIVHTERVYVSKIDGRKGFRRMVSETICNVTVHGNVEEGKTETEDRLEHDGTNPGYLVV